MNLGSFARHAIGDVLRNVHGNFDTLVDTRQALVTIAWRSQ